MVRNIGSSDNNLPIRNHLLTACLAASRRLGHTRPATRRDASSADIAKINHNVVSEAQKDYCVDHLFSVEEKTMSVDDLLGDAITNSEMRSAASLIDVVIEKRLDCKHTLQLKYLAGEHLGEIQPLIIGREQNARTFLFLIRGQKSLYLVLEPINEKLATYVWPCPVSVEEIASRTP